MNSQSNKGLPELGSLQLELGRMSNPPLERGGLADRSLDRVKAANFFMGKDLALSR
jgi:hypothetical protein